ncbi:hypothetical protein F0562_027937 [Nyssa sinensis]|uniref:Uncharacterized protein n=1 Tax=Nyssa sinensis TaxID=561372 RepID=A0A5J5B6R2_9ASTE|nr:hypothetical protein F0562_027937 [Nyssa sinensis]
MKGGSGRSVQLEKKEKQGERGAIGKREEWEAIEVEMARDKKRRAAVGEGGVNPKREETPVGRKSGSSVGIGIDGKVVKTGGDVMSNACVRVPVLIIVNCRGWGRRLGGVSDVGLRSGGRRSMKMVVESMPTSNSGMANFGADLTRRSGGMGLGVW